MLMNFVPTINHSIRSMKLFTLTSLLLILFQLKGFAQEKETGIMPPMPKGKDLTFTDWKKVEFTSGGEKLTYEYRIAFSDRKIIACYHELQIRNTSARKLSFKVKTVYPNQLEGRDFKEEYTETLKPGKPTIIMMIMHGCMADKDQKENADYHRCMDCGFSYTIEATVD